MQIELKNLWRYNYNVYVAEDNTAFAVGGGIHRGGGGLKMRPSQNGFSYVMFTEYAMIAPSFREFVIEMPFRDLMNKAYSNNIISSIAINPLGEFEGDYSTIVFFKDFLKELFSLC